MSITTVQDALANLGKFDGLFSALGIGPNEGCPFMLVPQEQALSMQAVTNPAYLPLNYAIQQLRENKATFNLYAKYKAKINALPSPDSATGFKVIMRFNGQLLVHLGNRISPALAAKKAAFDAVQLLRENQHNLPQNRQAIIAIAARELYSH